MRADLKKVSLLILTLGSLLLTACGSGSAPTSASPDTEASRLRKELALRNCKLSHLPNYPAGLVVICAPRSDLKTNEQREFAKEQGAFVSEQTKKWQQRMKSNSAEALQVWKALMVFSLYSPLDVLRIDLSNGEDKKLNSESEKLIVQMEKAIDDLVVSRIKISLQELGLGYGCTIKEIQLSCPSDLKGPFAKMSDGMKSMMSNKEQAPSAPPPIAKFKEELATLSYFYQALLTRMDPKAGGNKKAVVDLLRAADQEWVRWRE